MDTIIDLQIDEAPLLVRNEKSFGVGKVKCLTCNQIVRDTEDLNASLLFENHMENSQNNGSKLFSFGKLNSTTLKCGAGGYSRYLANLDNNISEEINKKKSDSVLTDIILAKDSTIKSLSHTGKREHIKLNKRLKTEHNSTNLSNVLVSDSNTLNNILLTENTNESNTINNIINNTNTFVKSDKIDDSSRNINNKKITLPDISKETIEKNIKTYLDSELNIELTKTNLDPSSLIKKTNKVHYKMRTKQKTNANK